MTDRKWEAEKYALSKMTIAFLPRRMSVKDAQGGEIGYTIPKDGIYIAHEHEVFSKLPIDEKRFFRKGVFAHELLHQIFTDFDTHQKMMKPLAQSEKEIFALFANVLEDPAIEYWAKTKFGGSLLKSLRFSIAHVYKQSPKIEESKDAFGQYINALIQFGDMGLVKGHFTFPEAKDTFMGTASLFNEGVMEPSGAERLKIAQKIMEIARPLWEEYAKEQEELRKMISELMDAAGKTGMSGEGRGEDGDSDSLPTGKSLKEKRRTSSLRKMSKEKSSDTSDSKGTSGDSSKDKAGEGSKSASSASGEAEAEGTEGFASSAKKTADAGDKTDPEKKDSATSSETSEDDGESLDEGKEEGESEGSELGEEGSEFSESESDDVEMSEDDREEMERDIENAKSDLEKEKAADARDSSPITTEPLKLGKITVPEHKILNERVPWQERNSRRYADIVSRMATGIANTTRQLRRMLTISQEDTEYATRGKLNINRLNCGKNTARVFDRKRIPSNIADLAVGIAVDLSGSMSGTRIDSARKCCIALAEIFSDLGIPVYVMGFTGSIGSYTVVHKHYVTWKNTKKDRESLANIEAMCENYDGASIRCFAKIMQKKMARHKLLIVISDGEPCGPGYFGTAANNDTALAIREAKKVCDVLGVAVGNDSTEILHSFYGGDFLHVDSPNELFAKLSLKLKKFVKKWIDEE